jgi:hypothetical protein
LPIAITSHQKDIIIYYQKFTDMATKITRPAVLKWSSEKALLVFVKCTFSKD